MQITFLKLTFELTCVAVKSTFECMQRLLQLNSCTITIKWYIRWFSKDFEILLHHDLCLLLNRDAKPEWYWASLIS